MLCNRTLSDIVAHLACSLNDYEGSELKRIAQKNCDYDPDQDGLPDGVDFAYDECEGELNHIRWSEKFITSNINDAFRILHMERPDLFTNRIRHLLKPGCRDQKVPDCCKFAGKLRNATDCEDDSKPIEVSQSQLRTSEAIGDLFCQGLSSTKKYVVKGVSFDPKSPHEFIVNPPAPFGQDTYVSFNCVEKAPCFEWDTDKDTEITSCLLDDYEPWFIEYSLFRAHMADRESESSFAAANKHWDNGFRLISEGKQSDYTFYHPDLYLVGPIAEGTGERIVLQSE